MIEDRTSKDQGWYLQVVTIANLPEYFHINWICISTWQIGLRICKCWNFVISRAVCFFFFFCIEEISKKIQVDPRCFFPGAPDHCFNLDVGGVHLFLWCLEMFWDGGRVLGCSETGIILYFDVLYTVICYCQ